MLKAEEIKAKMGLGGPPLAPIPSAPPNVPDHEMVRCIGQGSYGEVWLGRNTVGTWRAVKVVYRHRFKDARPYEREFSGIQRYEPLSRTNEGLVDVLQIGRNDGAGYFYYVMELADGARELRVEPGARLRKDGAATAQAVRGPSSGFDPDQYVPRTLGSQIRSQGRLPVDECITLGLTLSLALGYLHRQGLIHRDVKPSNIIFVSGVPKLADIGLVTDLSEALSFVGTEGFIPPEGPNSAQADLYALGKLLYEASMGKDRNEFPEPATIVSVDAESKRLMELNAVLLRACAPKTKDRYQTAEQMNADLALLHSGESVRDRHALARRFRITTRAAAGVAAVMVLGVIPYSVAIREARVATAMAKQAVTARHQAESNEEKAKTEAAKSRQVALFLEEMLKGAGPAVAEGRDTVMLREILEKTSDRLTKGPIDQPSVAAELENTVGEIWFALGQYEKAEAMHSRALALRKQLFGENHLAVAESLGNLAKALVPEGRLAEAEHLGRQSLAIRRALLGQEHPEVADSLVVLGNTFFGEGRRADADAAYREAMAMRQKLVGPESPAVADSLRNLASIFFVQDKLDDSELAYERAAAMFRKLLGDNSPELAGVLNSLANVLEKQGRLAQAETTYRECLALSTRLWSDGHPLRDQALDGLTEVLQTEGKSEEAEDLCRKDLSVASQRWGAGDWRLAAKFNRLGQALRAQGRIEEARGSEQEALAIARRLAVAASLRSEEIILQLADSSSRRRRFDEAEPLYKEALASARKFGTDSPVRLENRETALALCFKAQTKYGEAEKLLGEALASARSFATNQSSLARLEMRILNFAELLKAERKFTQAEPLCREGLELKKKRVGSEGYDVTGVLVGLGEVLQNEGKPSEAEKTFREAVGIARRANSNEQQKPMVLALVGLAWVLEAEGETSEAETNALEALTLRQQLKLQSSNDPGVADSFYQMASVWWAENRLGEAEHAARSSLELYERDLPDAWKTFHCCGSLGTILHSEQKYAEAEVSLRKALELARKAKVDEASDEVYQILAALGWDLHALNKLPEAEDVARRALAAKRILAKIRKDDRGVADAMYELAVVLKSERKFDKAESLAGECQEIYDRESPDNWQCFNCRATLGSIMVSREKHEQAKPLLLSAYQGLLQRKPDTFMDVKPRVKETLECLAQVCEATDRVSEAAEWRQKLAGYEQSPISVRR